jgi:hypothetical protein
MNCLRGEVLESHCNFTRSVVTNLGAHREQNPAVILNDY